MSDIGFIGVGELAVYTVKGLRRGGHDGRILLSPRNAERAAYLRHEFACEVLADNQSVVDASDMVFIATRPEHCIDALSALDILPAKLLVSVVAGIEIQRLRSVLPAGIEIVRVMPVSSAEVGASPTLVYPDSDRVRALFDSCGSAIPVDDEACFTQGSIHACVYSWFFALYQELIAATRSPALPEEINRQLVMGMAEGAARLALSKQEMTPLEIADGIATEGTYSKLGLDLLRDKNAFDPWREACGLLAKRLAGED